MDHEVEMLRHLLRQPPHVLQGLELDPKPGVTYHVSPNKSIEVFTPRKIQRTMDFEDEIVPRVCTGVTILDCIRGYAVMARDYLKNKATCAGKDDWLGGYVIYAIPYQCSVFPKQTMAPMAQWCRERWLIDYLEDEQQYPAEQVGKFFIQAINIQKEDHAINVEVDIYLEIFGEQEVPWDNSLGLLKGFHHFKIPFFDSYYSNRYKQQEISYESITREAYETWKKRKAALLNYDGAPEWTSRW